MYQKILRRKTCCLLLRGEGERKHYGLINDFNRFICDYSLNLGKINFVVIVHTLSLEKKKLN